MWSFDRNVENLTEVREISLTCGKVFFFFIWCNNEQGEGRIRKAGRRIRPYQASGGKGEEDYEYIWVCACQQPGSE